jgi:E1A/CREB-binding protein
LLAEKIYKIQKELQEKKNRRLHEQAGSDFRPGPPGPGGMHSMGNQPMGMGNQQMPNHIGMNPLSAQAYPFPYSAQDSQQQMQPTPQQMQQQPRPQSQQALMSIPSVPNLHSGPQPPNHMHDQQMHSSQNLPLNNIKSELTDGRPEMMLQKQESIKIEPSESIKVERPPSSAATNRKFSPPPPPIKREHKEELVEEKRFDPNELRSYLKPICDKLLDTEESIPFRIPVDAVALKIPVSN